MDYEARAKEKVNEHYLKRENVKYFMHLVESYYGPYANNITRLIIVEYLLQFNSDQLKELFGLVKNFYPNSYKSPPDEFRFREAFKKKYDQLGLIDCGKYFIDKLNKVYDKNMVLLGYYDGDRFIPDCRSEKVRQKVIEHGSQKIDPGLLIEFKDK